MINLTISAKDLKDGINYRPFEKIMVNKTEDRVLFLAQNLVKEVREGTEKQQLKNIKKMKKYLKTSLSVLGAGLGITTRAFAVAPTAAAVNPITPAVIMEWGLTLGLIAVAVGVALSMILLAVAGTYRMMRKQREATEWTNDIIRGLVQVLIAIPSVYLLYFLAQLLFKNLPMLSGLF